MAKHRLIETPEGKYRVQKRKLGCWYGLQPQYKWFKIVGISGNWSLDSYQSEYCDIASYDKAFYFYKLVTENNEEPRVLMETEE